MCGWVFVCICYKRVVSVSVCLLVYLLKGLCVCVFLCICYKKGCVYVFFYCYLPVCLHSQFFDYAMSVLYPECLVRLIMEFYHVDFETVARLVTLSV